MRRREAALLIGSAALGTALGWCPATAQQPIRVYRIGIMAGTRRDEAPWPAFFDELARVGFIEGANLQVDGHFSMRDDNAPVVARSLAENRIDAIVTGGYPRTRAAQIA